MATLEELEAELKKRGSPISSASVLAPEESSFAEFQKAGESLLKGGAKGLVDIVGGWGNLYDHLKQSKDPSALSSQGILNGLKSLTGIDAMKIQGYPGAFEAGQAAGPAVALATVNPAFGLFSPAGAVQKAAGTAGRYIAEGTVAAGMGQYAQSVAPDSPLAQMAIQMTPGFVKPAARGINNLLTKPTGSITPAVAALQDVGRMTPGEASGSRRQLATEARVEASPRIEAKATEFRQGQAQDAEGFLTQLFDRSSSRAITDPQEAASKLSGAFLNYGKTLANKLRKDASADFGAAETSGGIVDAQPIVAKVLQLKAGLSSLSPTDMALSPKLDTIINELFIPAKVEVRTPSLVVGADGAPAFTAVEPATAAGTKGMAIPDLKKALSDWGKAAYSGEYTLNGSNVFEGVAPGQAKGVARAILRGYKDALDVAIDQGIAGADKLKLARDNFSANLNQIDEFSERPIVKAFGKPLHQLVPETDVIPVLKDMPQTQRKLLFQIMGSQSPEMADTIRRLQFSDVLTKAQEAASGASASDPSFVIKTALTQMNSKKGDFGFLFNNPAEAANAAKAMQWMQKVLQSESASSFGSGAGEASAVARGFGGTSQTANIVHALGTAIRDLAANPNNFANVIFNKGAVDAILAAQAKSTPQKLVDAMSSIGKASAISAVKAGPRMAVEQPLVEGEEAPVNRVDVPMGFTEADIDALVAEQQRRAQ